MAAPPVFISARNRRSASDFHPADYTDRTFESLPDAAAISLRDLWKSYGAVQAVRGVSLDILRGKVFGFLGLNGAGKTTTIRILLDLLRPSRGAAAIFDIDCQKESLKTRTLVGYLPGELGFYPDMTGEEILQLMSRLSGVVVSDEYQLQIVDRLELARSDLRRQLREYSTGMKRKLGLVQALQADPPLLILDEPTEGLDPLVQRSLHEILFELRGRGRTVFMSSHVLSEVERLCDRIAVIRKGEIVLLSTVEEARRLTGRIVRVHFAEAVQPIALPQRMAFVDRNPQQWTLRVEGDVGELIGALSQFRIRDVEIIEPALEDVLRNFYRQDSA